MVPTPQRSILVVDDDQDVCRMFALALAKLGHVTIADDGEHALRLVRAHKYDAIVLDLHMPQVDGFVILAETAASGNPNRETPVYIASADTSEDARVEALSARAVFFLGKPVSLKTMVALIESQFVHKTE